MESIGKSYKPWLIASVAALVTSLVLLAVAVVFAFLAFNHQGTPFWVIALGGVSIFGIVIGFTGMFSLVAIAGWQSFREHRRVQIISPSHDDTNPEPPKL